MRTCCGFNGGLVSKNITNTRLSLILHQQNPMANGRDVRINANVCLIHVD